MSRLTAEYRHEPVMLAEVLKALAPAPDSVVCDCTLGGAGHARALAKELGKDGLLIGIDQDPEALNAAEQRLNEDAPDTRRLLLRGNFSDLDELLLSAEIPGVDCFLFDLGVSSPQLDFPERGFSYKEDAPLDMRMDPEKNTLNAAEVINQYDEADLIRILREYGDERFASRIAAKIVTARSKAPIQTTTELAEIISSAIPAPARRRKGHPARKSFQAIRIEVNGELDALKAGLEAAVRWLNPDGRICVISYHSLEDRIVSHLFNEYSKGCTCPPDFPVCVCGNKPILRQKTKRALVASDEEVAANARARSALMRVATKCTIDEEGQK